MMKTYPDNETEDYEEDWDPAGTVAGPVRALCMAAGAVVIVLTGVALVAAVVAFLTVLLALAAWLLPELVRLRMNGGSAGPALVGFSAAFAGCGLSALTYVLHSCGVWFFDKADELESK